MAARKWRSSSRSRSTRGRVVILGSEHEEYCPAEAQARPEVIEPHGFLHIEGGKRHEDAERDDFLKDLELAELQLRMTDAVRRHLQQILEQRDPPAHQRGDDPGPLAQMPEVCVPGERHEDVGEDEQDDGFGNDRHAGFPRRSHTYFSTRNTSRAARRPLDKAPATVPICAPSVASPAKKSVPSTGRASARGALLPPTPM